MEQSIAQQDELSARREAMRERLRLQADRILQAVEQIEDPKTFVEVERAARAIIATDKMIIQMFSAPKVAECGKRDRSSRMPVDRTVDAPIVAVGDTSPVTQGKMTEAVTSRVFINDVKPVSGRLTKRQKRRQRAFKAETPTTGHGSGLSP